MTMPYLWQMLGTFNILDICFTNLRFAGRGLFTFFVFVCVIFVYIDCSAICRKKIILTSCAWPLTIQDVIRYLSRTFYYSSWLLRSNPLKKIVISLVNARARLFPKQPFNNHVEKCGKLQKCFPMFSSFLFKDRKL